MIEIAKTIRRANYDYRTNSFRELQQRTRFFEARRESRDTSTGTMPLRSMPIEEAATEERQLRKGGRSIGGSASWCRFFDSVASGAVRLHPAHMVGLYPIAGLAPKQCQQGLKLTRGHGQSIET
jgi:hypothetical protein